MEELPAALLEPVTWRGLTLALRASPGAKYHRCGENYIDLTVTSLEIIVSKGNHPKMALSLVSEIL